MSIFGIVFDIALSIALSLFSIVLSNFGIVMAFLWLAERPVLKLTLDIF